MFYVIAIVAISKSTECIQKEMRKKVKHITKKDQEGSKRRKRRQTENNQVIVPTLNIRDLNSPIKRLA